MESTLQEKSKNKLDKDIATILLRRRSKLVVAPGKENNVDAVKAMSINVASLGYIFSPELIKVLETLSLAQLKKFHNFLIPTLSEFVGGHVKYRPLFRNFPDDVPETFSYYFDRVVAHFQSMFGMTENAKLLSCGHLINLEKFDLSNFGACPVCQRQVEEDELLPAKERTKLSAKEKIVFKEITLGEEHEIFEVFKNLLSSNTSISMQDKEDITDIFTIHLHDISIHIPQEIPHKEVLAHFASLVLRGFDTYELVTAKVKTATDILRVATSLSEGDISLATASKFKKFSNKERRFLLELLENCSSIEEDMVRYAKNWIRLGEILHPGDYSKKYPKTFAAFTKIRNNEHIDTFNSRTEKLMKELKLSELIDHLMARPGEFGRKLDFILSRLTKKEIPVALEKFTKAAERIPTPTLLQIKSNFVIRSSKDKDIRIILPKGNLAKVKIIDETRVPIEKSVSERVVDLIDNELMTRFSKLPKLGKIYLDENLSTYLLPASQRSASKSLLTIPRGSQVSLTDDEVVRMFIYWKQPAVHRTDVDLSTILFDENWNCKGQVSWTNYHEDGMVHSGDITSAPNGASEFIDIKKSVVLKSGVRYVAMNIYNFTGQNFVELPECFAGFMGRKKPKSGEIFEPKTVKFKFDVAAEGAIAIPLILDLVENKMIWTDIALKGRMADSVHRSGGTVQLIAKALSQMVKFKCNLYDLLLMHAEMRGEIVAKPEDADLVFSEETISSQMDTIMSEYIK